MVGVATLLCNVRTSCVNGTLEIGSIRVNFIGLTLGLFPIGQTVFDICLNSNSIVKPSIKDLTGFSAIYTAGVAGGKKGGSLAAIKLGKVKGDITGPQKGLDAPSVDSYVGYSYIDKNPKELCCGKVYKGSF